MLGRRGLGDAQLRKRFSRHHFRGDFRVRLALCLGNKRHSSRSAWVDFDDVNLAVLDRVLHVHQAANAQRLGQRPGFTLQPFDDLFRQRIRRERASGIARVNASFLDMLHHADPPPPTKSRLCPAIALLSVVGIEVRCAVDIHFRSGVKEFIDQDRRIDNRRRLDGVGHVVIELVLIVDDFHRTAAEHEARTHENGIADLPGDFLRFSLAAGDAIFGLGVVLSFCSRSAVRFLISRGVERIDAGSQNRNARFNLQPDSARIQSGVCPPNCTMTPSRSDHICHPSLRALLVQIAGSQMFRMSSCVSGSKKSRSLVS